MRYPDRVTLLRAAGEDRYGNPARGWANPQVFPGVSAFYIPTTGQLLCPAGTGLRDGDRVRLTDGRLFTVKDPVVARSPSRAIAERADVEQIPEGG